MKNRFRQCLLAGLLLSGLIVSPVHAREIAGVKLDDSIEMPGSGKLVLNGAGIRYKFFFKIYVGALYLADKQSDANALLAKDAASRMMMHITYDEVPREKLVDAWIEGFNSNNSEATMQLIQQKLDRFNGWFTDLKQGDVVLLDYLPAEGTRVTIKGVQKGVIEGREFNRALLSVWLGEDPVTEELKDALLGVEE